MSHLLDEILTIAADGSDIVVALSAESVATLFFASGFLDDRSNWLDRRYDPLDEVTDADWDAIEKLVANAYEEIMHPVLAVGTVNMWLTDTPPEKWLVCNGDEISRADYAELFALWGTAFGAGDGSTTFLLPDMRSLHPMGVGALIDVGEVIGSSSYTLTVGQLPTHNHGVNDPGHTHDEQINVSPAYTGAAGTARTQFQGAQTGSTVRAHTDSNTTGITTQNAGSGDALQIQLPSMGVNYIVYAGV